MKENRTAHIKAHLVKLTALDKQVKEKMAQQPSFKLDSWETDGLDSSLLLKSCIAPLLTAA